MNDDRVNHVTVEDAPPTWTCARCGLIMLALSRELHEALHEHVRPSIPKSPDPRIDEILALLRVVLGRLNRMEWKGLGR